MVCFVLFSDHRALSRGVSEGKERSCLQGVLFSQCGLKKRLWRMWKILAVFCTNCASLGLPAGCTSRHYRPIHIADWVSLKPGSRKKQVLLQLQLASLLLISVGLSQSYSQTAPLIIGGDHTGSEYVGGGCSLMSATKGAICHLVQTFSDLLSPFPCAHPIALTTVDWKCQFNCYDCYAKLPFIFMDRSSSEGRDFF